MEKILTLKELANACKGQLINGDECLYVTDIVTDSRKVVEGSVFVALRGEKFDGHNFAAQTIQNMIYF